MIRYYLLFLLSIFACQSLATIPANAYYYDAAEYSVVGRNIHPETQNHQYDDISNFRYCCSESLNIDLQEKTLERDFLALLGDFIVTKGAGELQFGRKLDFLFNNYVRRWEK